MAYLIMNVMKGLTEAGVARVVRRLEPSDLLIFLVSVACCSV